MTMRGIDSEREVDPQRLLRDTRTLSERIAQFYRKPSNSAMVMGCIAVFILLIFFIH